MPDQTKRIVYSMLLAGMIGLSGNAVAEQIVNGDFETGDSAGWTKTGTAFSASPTQNDQAGLFSGWQNAWYVNTFLFRRDGHRHLAFGYLHVDRNR